MKEQINPAVTPYLTASRVSRYIAFSIDMIIFMLLYSLVILVFLHLSNINFEEIPKENAEQILEYFKAKNINVGKFPNNLFMALAAMALVIVVNVPFWKKNGQSIGKVFMKIKIVNNDNSPASLNTIIAKRYVPFALLSFAPVIGYFLYVLDGAMIFRDSKKCYHDDFAGTKVVVDTASSK